MVLERSFQSKLVKELRDMNFVVLKTNYIIGFPDLIVLGNGRYACLEVKKDRRARRGPNQEMWVKKMDDMSFARIIYPENKDEVIHKMVDYLVGG